MNQSIEFFSTSTGKKSARIHDTNLYSRYDPEKEAFRFIEQTMENKNPLTIVVLGAGLGYVVRTLRDRFPEARIICLYYHQELYKESRNPGDVCWHPDQSETVLQFFQKVLCEYDVEGLEYIEWPPCAQAFPAISEIVHQALLQVLRENAGNLVTTIKSGNRWVRNAVYNFVLIDNPCIRIASKKREAVVIAASGPSLQKALPLILRYRASIQLWALPSSVKFLHEYGIFPDCVVCTDGNYWAQTLFHFHTKSVPFIAMPLSASYGVPRFAERIFLFEQPAFFEKELFNSASVVPVSLPPHGTVAGSALMLALQTGFSQIIFTGLDFCYDNINSHVNPHPFTDMLFHASTRRTPFLHNIVERALSHAPEYNITNNYRSSPALRAYAGSFRFLSEYSHASVFRLFPAQIDIPGIKEISNDACESLFSGQKESKEGTGFSVTAHYPEKSERIQTAINLMDSWLEIFDSAKRQSKNEHLLTCIQKSVLLSEITAFLTGQSFLEARKKYREGKKRESEESLLLGMVYAEKFVHSMKTRIGESILHA